MEIDSSSPPSRIRQAEKAVVRAEQDAQEKITSARKRVAAAEQEAQTEIEHQRDLYAKRSDEERAKAELDFQQQKFKGYERLRDAQRMDEKEISRARQDGQKTLTDTEKRYEHAVFETQKEGQARLDDAVRKNYALEQFTRRQNEGRLAAMEQDHDAQMMAIHFKEEEVRDKTLADSSTRQKQIAETSRQAILDAEAHNQEAFEINTQKNLASQERLATTASRQLEQLRRETAHRLDAYSSRQKDPFYKLVELDPKVSESDAAFTITARIPEHEQGSISIRMQGNSLVLSGQRRNVEVAKSEDEPGRETRTASHQSFSETIPLGYPVNPKLLVREFKGDELVITVPKRTTYEAPKTNLPKRSEVTGEIAERPRFPKNLPGEKALADMAGTAAKDGKKTLV